MKLGITVTHPLQSTQSEKIMKNFSFPIRLKVLLTVLAILMLVVGVITSTMTNLFHEDKTGYVRDHSATVTNDIRVGVFTLVSSYVSATRVLSEVLFADYLEPNSKESLIGPVFAAYPELMAMVSTNSDGQPISIYNAASVEQAGIASADIRDLISLTREHEKGSIEVRSARIEPDQTVVILMVDYVNPRDNETRVVVAVLSPRLFRASLRRGGAIEVSLLGANDEVIATVDRSGENAGWAYEALQEFETLSGSTVIEYSSDSGDYIAGAGRIDTMGITVVTRISASTAYFTARQLLDKLVTFGLGVVLLAALGGVALSRRITRPLERLSSAVRKIGKGDFNVNVDINSHDEIGQLSNSFNEMVEELNAREQSLQKAQLALVQSEKMAAIGTLTAGLAHEVKNPLSAVLGYAQLAKRKLPQASGLHQHLDTIESETRRCNDIIGNLMQFSRQEKGEFSEICANDVVEKTVGIVDHQLSLKNVRIETNLMKDLPTILGNRNLLQQVIMNLAINAQQAMGQEGGIVSITTDVKGDSALIIVDDTGPGIDQDVADKIFEPFYTTKPAGQGTGLGLSVTYGIVLDHGGDISIGTSSAGGARFTIRLPLSTVRDMPAANDGVMEKAS